MAKPRESALAKHRRRMRKQGMMRIELSIPRADAALFRQLAASISDAPSAAETRAFLRRRFPSTAKSTFKDYLAAAPLEGIDLERERDMGRDVEP